MLLISFPSVAVQAVNGCEENSVVFVQSPTPPSSVLTPSTETSNPSFKVTSSPPPPSKQVTRPAVAMVTSHNQSRDEGRKDGRRGSNHKDDSITPLPASALLHTGNFFLCATFLRTQDSIFLLPSG